MQMILKSLRWVILFFVLFCCCATTFVCSQHRYGFSYKTGEDFPFLEELSQEGYIGDSFDPSLVHVVVVNPSLVKMDLVRCGLRNTVSGIARNYSAPFAIVGGFYRKDKKPSGIFKKAGRFLEFHGNQEQGAIGWNSDDLNHVQIDRLYRTKQGDLCPILEVQKEEFWRSASNILGSTPVLLKNGQILDFVEEGVPQSFLCEYYPRSAMGIRNDGFLIFAVIDATSDDDVRRCGVCGMSMKGLAEFMRRLGCTQAINLCGGRSTSMFYLWKALYHGSREKTVSNVLVLQYREKENSGSSQNDGIDGIKERREA